MAAATSSVWVCSVCGYVHCGDEPPEVCPVCGAPADAFEVGEPEAAAPATVDATRWRCLNCDYIHEGAEPPEACPVCAAPPDQFEGASEAGARHTANGTSLRAVVIGGGIAGLSAVESLREANPNAEIRLIAKEDALPYYRLNLTRYLAGELSAPELPIHSRDWYDDHGIELALGTEVTALDLERQQIICRGGTRESFDSLILAAGAHPFVPPFAGANKEGVNALRTLDDADHILAANLTNRPCVVIGGGLLGLEAAGALARRGADVTILEGHGWLLPRQLNEQAGQRLAEHVTAIGVKLRPNARTEALLGDEHVHAVELADGTILPTDLVIVATGIRPNSYLARKAGLDVHNGITVDNHLRTRHPRVFAAGDIAEHRGLVYGVWGPSQYQGRIAGLNAAGQNAEFAGIPRSNTLKVLGLELFSMGTVQPEDGSYLAVDVDDNNRYCRFVFHDSHLVGAILLGDASATVRVKKAIEERQDFSAMIRHRPDGQVILEYLTTH